MHASGERSMNWRVSAFNRVARFAHTIAVG
jgi:hypothetical protein